MAEAGEWMDPDLNKYNLHHRVSHHPTMSDAEWDDAYRAAWDAYFTWDHIETVARRHAVLPANRPRKAAQYLTDFKMLYDIEGLHALEGGIFRRKRRRARRPSFPQVPALLFYPQHVAQSAWKVLRYLNGYRRARAMVRRVLADPARYDYTDASLAPPAPEDFDTLGLFQETTGGTHAVAKQLRQEELAETVKARRAAAPVAEAQG